MIGARFIRQLPANSGTTEADPDELVTFTVISWQVAHRQKRIYPPRHDYSIQQAPVREAREEEEFTYQYLIEGRTMTGDNLLKIVDQQQLIREINSKLWCRIGNNENN